LALSVCRVSNNRPLFERIAVMSNPEHKPVLQSKVLNLGLNFLRGALIGIAEIIPGVSGGTIALITGVYTRIINSASDAVRGFLLLFGFSRSKLAESTERFKAMSWALLIPLLIGMVTAIFAAAGLVEPLLEQYPTLTRALFAGLIAASLIVPIRLSGSRWGVFEYLIALIAAVAGFVLTSIPRGMDADPGFFVIVASAAVAVCALVLPGISGSYLLLALGMYTPTLAAVNNRDFGYLGTFVLGAILGLAAFVSALQWLLEHRRKLTLVIMTGLMVGSLRALWPWQSESGELLPAADFQFELLSFGVGVLFVGATIWVERLALAKASKLS
jgi:putative membrane protein